MSTPNPRSSTPLLLAALVAVVVLAAVAVTAGVPLGVGVVGAVMVGGAIVARLRSDRRLAGATAQDPKALEGFSVLFPAERYAVGKLFQVRLLPPTSRVWAPGMLGFGAGHVEFVPSQARRADRAWRGTPTAVEVHAFARASVVRVRTADGDDGQFALQVPPDIVRSRLAPLVPLVPLAGDEASPVRTRRGR